MLDKKIMVMLAIAGACSAGAQTTVATLGEVMDKGAVKVDKAKWIAMLPTTNIGMGQTRRETTTTKIHYQQNGRLDGQLFGNHDPLAISGSWKIEDDGKLCIDQRYPSEGSFKGCFYMFRNGNEIYHMDAGYRIRDTEPGSDRGATVIVRKIEE